MTGADYIAKLQTELNTERELTDARETSSQNLAAYARDEKQFALPMAGPDLVTRDVIAELRRRLAVYERESRGLRRLRQAIVHVDEAASGLRVAASMLDMICARCQCANKPGARICSNCGVALDGEVGDG